MQCQFLLQGRPLLHIRLCILGHGCDVIRMIRLWYSRQSQSKLDFHPYRCLLCHIAFRKILWGSKILQSPPTVTYEEVMDADERGLFKWLSNVDKFGFCFISGVPVTTEATEELSRRIAFIRETQCQLHVWDLQYILTHTCADGTFWDFTSDLAKGDTAYTTMALGAHTDTTYFVSLYLLFDVYLLTISSDGPLWTAIVPFTRTHRGNRWFDAARRRILRCINPERATS